MKPDRKEILLAFYGDDFTGSTDALEFLTRAGARTILFLNPPTEEQLGKFEHLDAIGIAGMTRALPQEAMRSELLDAFDTMKGFNSRHIHYKVCSTFDSSPEIGNIGTAITVGQETFRNDFTPILVASPTLGRFSAFGNLFAQMGIGSNGQTYRLDRHPSMSKHPVTPALESDLRLHLGAQTDLKMGLIDLMDLKKPIEEILSKIELQVREGAGVIFFDAMYESQMETIGKAWDRLPKISSSLFSVGSSGVEKALGDHWFSEGKLAPRIEWETITSSSPMLVLSGSASPVTADQIKYALDHGFEEVVVSPDVFKEGTIDRYIESYAEEVLALLKNGKHVIMHTCKGPEDERIDKTKELIEKLGWDVATQRKETPYIFGKVLGGAARKALTEHPVDRLIIAGGDTSSYVARELGINAVEMIAPVFIGAPLCRAYAEGSPLAGIQVNLKGGQVGDETYFVKMQKGTVK